MIVSYGVSGSFRALAGLGMAELGGGGGAEVGTWPCGDLTPQEKDLEDLMGDLVEDMDAGAAGGLHQPIGPWNPCNLWNLYSLEYL